MYSADGYMAVVNTPKGRKPVSETVARMDLDATTPAERAEAALGVVAYAGRFEVSGEEVRHTLFTAVNPYGSAERRCGGSRSSGDDLTLSAPPDANGDFCASAAARGKDVAAHP